MRCRCESVAVLESSHSLDRRLTPDHPRYLRPRYGNSGSPHPAINGGALRITVLVDASQVGHESKRTEPTIRAFLILASV